VVYLEFALFDGWWFARNDASEVCVVHLGSVVFWCWDLRSSILDSMCVYNILANIWRFG
jgi:hypothetical protein